MLILIDDREIVAVGYAGGFKSEGVCSTGFCPADFRGWVETVADQDLGAVEAFLIGNCRDRMSYPGWIRERSNAPIIAALSRGVSDGWRNAFQARHGLGPDLSPRSLRSPGSAPSGCAGAGRWRQRRRWPLL